MKRAQNHEIMIMPLLLLFSRTTWVEWWWQQHQHHHYFDSVKIRKTNAWLHFIRFNNIIHHSGQDGAIVKGFHSLAFRPKSPQVATLRDTPTPAPDTARYIFDKRPRTPLLIDIFFRWKLWANLMAMGRGVWLCDFSSFGSRHPMIDWRRLAKKEFAGQIGARTLPKPKVPTCGASSGIIFMLGDNNTISRM